LHWHFEEPNENVADATAVVAVFSYSNNKNWTSKVMVHKDFFFLKQPARV